MSLRTASQPKTWGTAAVTTLVVLAAAVIGLAAGTALFWVSVTDNPTWTLTTIARFLVLAAIAADVQFMWTRGRRLLRLYRRAS